jgi:NDP-sugar pyrophosphorylase family protein
MSPYDLRAVILAGGLGTRLGDLAQGLPKAMVPVDGRPFLEYGIAQLANQGFRDILLLVGYRAEAIETHFGDGAAWGVHIRYSREQVPMGTGGAVGQARDLISGRFLLLYGDLYRPYDYSAFLTRRKGNVLAVYPYVPGLTTIGCANVGLDPATGRVRQYLKNAPGAGLTHVDAGFGAFGREVVELLPHGACSFEEAVYPALAGKGQLEAELVDRHFLDIGNPADLAHARSHPPTP